MDLHFQRHAIVPPYTRDLTSQDQFKWSAEFEIPAIGNDIVIRVNGIGRANVVGYAAHGGYLGVMCVPHSPPAWWVRQNGPASAENAALAYGAEISLIVPGQTP